MSGRCLFYVYVYLDPRKPGSYIYGEYTFDYEPFYIGKGKNDIRKRKSTRMFNHLVEALSNWDIENLRPQGSFKCNKIRKIINETGNDPIIIKYQDDMNEKDSYSLEIQLIKEIGRYDLNTGPLTNLTDGGLGCTRYGLDNAMYGKTHSKTTIKKWKKSIDRYYKKIENREKASYYSSLQYMIDEHGKTLGRLKYKEIQKKKAICGDRNYFFGKSLCGEKNGFYGKGHLTSGDNHWFNKLSKNEKEKLLDKKRGKNSKLSKIIIIDGRIYNSIGEASRILKLTTGCISGRIRSINEKFKEWEYYV